MSRIGEASEVSLDDDDDVEDDIDVLLEKKTRKRENVMPYVQIRIGTDCVGICIYDIHRKRDTRVCKHTSIRDTHPDNAAARAHSKFYPSRRHTHNTHPHTHTHANTYMHARKRTQSPTSMYIEKYIYIYVYMYDEEAAASSGITELPVYTCKKETIAHV